MTTHEDVMDDLELILQRVYSRCRAANPYHMSIPESGETVVEYMLEEIAKLRAERKHEHTIEEK